MTTIDLMLSDLKRHVTPPPTPMHGGTPDDWEQLRRQGGFDLPRDYQALLSAYGVGEFFNFLFLISPFDPRGRFIDQSDDLLSQYNRFYSFHNQKPPFPVFPQSGGLLSFGGDTNGDVLAWITEGDPERWKVLWLSSDVTCYDVFEFGALAFFTKIVTREIVPELIDGIEFIDWDNLVFRQFPLK